MMTLPRFALALGALALLACSSDSSDADSGLMNGTYNGTFSGTDGKAPISGTITFDLTQEIDKVKGSWKTSTGVSGNVTAVISEGAKNGEAVISGEMDSTTPCAKSFIIGGTVKNNALLIEASYNGNGCTPNQSVEVKFTATR